MATASYWPCPFPISVAMAFRPTSNLGCTSVLYLLEIGEIGILIIIKSHQQLIVHNMVSGNNYKSLLLYCGQ